MEDRVLMNLLNILEPDQLFCHVNSGSKKRTLQYIAQTITRKHTELSADELFEQLVLREKLGNTGLGNGFALPHCRLSGCTRPLALFLQLDNPVDFDTEDNQLIDLVFSLVVPENCADLHLQLLRQTVSLFDRKEVCHALRCTDSSASLYRIFSHHLQQNGNTTVANTSTAPNRDTRKI